MHQEHLRGAGAAGYVAHSQFQSVCKRSKITGPVSTLVSSVKLIPASIGHCRPAVANQPKQN